MAKVTHCVCVWFVLNVGTVSFASQHTLDELRGTWRGTSKCADRVATLLPGNQVIRRVNAARVP
jgi:hypothetical protein